MRIITLTCPTCDTVVAGNVLEAERRLKCPNTSCEDVVSFDRLSEGEQAYLIENREQYRID